MAMGRRILLSELTLALLRSCEFSMALRVTSFAAFSHIHLCSREACASLQATLMAMVYGYYHRRGSRRRAACKSICCNERQFAAEFLRLRPWLYGWRLRRG